MKIKEVAAIIEDFAPIAYQELYDNSGLNLGNPEAEVRGILLCVDITDEVVDEAISAGDNLIVSHHPLLFHPLRQIVEADYIQRLVARCIKADIALYASHTSLDSAPGGMSFRLAHQIGLQNISLLIPRGDALTGFGAMGDLPNPEKAVDFLRVVKRKLGCEVIRHSALCRETVRRVALSTGSGGSFIPDACRAGADIYLSADFRYNDFFTDGNGIIVADLGHFETEYCAIDLLYDIITKKIATFAVHKSKSSVNPVRYLV